MVTGLMSQFYIMMHVRFIGLKIVRLVLAAAFNMPLPHFYVDRLNVHVLTTGAVGLEFVKHIP